MRERKSEGWQLLFGLFLTAAATAILWPMISTGALPWMEAHPELAAWVQAVGSILALGVAIWIASQQARQAASERVEQRRETAAAVAAVAQAAVTLIGEAEAEFNHNVRGPPFDRAGIIDDYLRNDYRPQQFQDLADLFLRIALEKLQSASLVPAALKIREALLGSMSILDRAKQARAAGRPVDVFAGERLAFLASDARQALDELAPEQRREPQGDPLDF